MICDPQSQILIRTRHVSVASGGRPDRLDTVDTVWYTPSMRVMLCIILGYGACGWIVTFELFNADQYFGGVVCFITAASLTALAVIMAILLQKVRQYSLSRTVNCHVSSFRVSCISCICKNRYVYSCTIVYIRVFFLKNKELRKLEFQFTHYIQQFEPKFPGFLATCGFFYWRIVCYIEKISF